MATPQNKCSLLLVLLVSIQTMSAVNFDEWCLEHGKVYNGELDKKVRKSVFASNVRLVESLNQQYNSSNVGFAINQFADLTPKEFRQKVLLPSRLAPSLPATRYCKFQADLVPPVSFDWRDKGVVSSVKNQGSVGSCWAFSTVGNIEGQWALKTGHLTSLSAEQLVECDDTYDPKNLHQDCGVFGGWPYLAYSYIEKVGGIESDDDYPYCSGVGKCFPCVPAGWNNTRCGAPPLYCNQSQSCSKKLNVSKFLPGLKIKDWIAVEKNESMMVNALIQQGPLSIAINAELLQFYKFGVWNPPGCKTTNLDHAVLLVGYGTQSGLFGKQPYWLIKNSWGVKWGTDGYFKMARGKGTCGVDQQVTSAVLQ